MLPENWFPVRALFTKNIILNHFNPYCRDFMITKISFKISFLILIGDFMI